MSKSIRTLTCCYKECQNDSPLDARMEVKTVLPKSISKTIKSQFLVLWRSNGEAEFHIDCWDELYLLSRSWSRKAEIRLTKEEQSMVKIAAEAPEQFDSIDSVKNNAKQAAEWIKESKHLVTFTGAGISTSAGIGDYRGKAGKWTEEDQTMAVSKTAVFDNTLEDSGEPPKKKVKVEKVAAGVSTESGDESATSNEDDVDDGVQYEKLRPTYTHEALNKLREAGLLKYVISQNGDGLHMLSGIPANQISELHGNVFVEVCEKCKQLYHRKSYVLDDVGSQYFEELEDYGRTTVKKPKHAVKCDRCGLSHRTGRRCESKDCKGFLRDTIINFRDLLDEDILNKAGEMSKKCDLMLCLGTTLQVTPACHLVRKVSRRNKLVICNRQETPVDDSLKKTGSGCRVFGDCDFFMREVMKHIFPSDELQEWEQARPERMKAYDRLRD